MIQPRKIRVLYFDECPDTLIQFVEFCGCKDIIEMIGTFRSFTEIASLYERDDYNSLTMLEADAIVLKLDRPDAKVTEMLQNLKNHCHIKLIGLISQDCAEDTGVVGVFDYYTKQSGPYDLMTDEDTYNHLLYQIKSARLALNMEKAGITGKWAVLPLPPKAENKRRFKLIAIGASTGGTEAVTKILASMRPDTPPIVIVQHLPENFTDFFAKNLAGRVPIKVIVPGEMEQLTDGAVYLAGNDMHMEVVHNERGEVCAHYFHGDKVSGHRPSVDVLFSSVAKVAGASAMGIILTGMGSDGANGLLQMHEAGAYTIGQDKESCAVYGMPMAAHAINAVSKQLPLNAIADAILSATSKGKEESNHE